MCSVCASRSPAVSPSVVAAIFMIQKISVTCGNFPMFVAGTGLCKRAGPGDLH
jgi:hypothetical protein